MHSLLAAATLATLATVQRSEFHVTTSDGVRIAVREVRPTHRLLGVEPVVLLHGARVQGAHLRVVAARVRGCPVGTLRSG